MTLKNVDGLHIDGTLFVRVSARRDVNLGDAIQKDEMVADIVAAMQAANNTVSDTPLPDKYASIAATLVWMKFVTLRPQQIAALVDLQVRAGTADASLLSMVLDTPASAMKALVNKTTKAVQAEQEEADRLADTATEATDETKSADIGL